MADEAIRVACPACRQIYKVPPESVGRNATCKRCGSTFAVAVSTGRATLATTSNGDVGSSKSVARTPDDASEDSFVSQFVEVPPRGGSPSTPMEVPSGDQSSVATAPEPQSARPGILASLRSIAGKAVAGIEAQAEEHRRQIAAGEKKSFSQILVEHKGLDRTAVDSEPPKNHLWMLVRFCGCSLSTDFGLDPKQDVFAYCADSCLVLRKLKGISLNMNLRETTSEVFRIPLLEIEAVEVESAERMTLGRIGAGYLLAGPFGAVIGGLWKKQDKFVRIDWGGKHSIVFGKSRTSAEALRQSLVESIRQVKAAKPSRSAAESVAPPKLDIADALRRLESLRDDGILSDEEFEAKRSALVSRS